MKITVCCVFKEINFIYLIASHPLLIEITLLALLAFDLSDNTPYDIGPLLCTLTVPPRLALPLELFTLTTPSPRTNAALELMRERALPEL